MMSRVSGDFAVQLARDFLDWSAGGLPRCGAARWSVCRVVLQSQRAQHVRLVADKSLASSSSHRRPTRAARPITSWHVSDILARTSRGCYEETAPVEFQLKQPRRSVPPSFPPSLRAGSAVVGTIFIRRTERPFPSARSTSDVRRISPAVRLAAPRKWIGLVVVPSWPMTQQISPVSASTSWLVSNQSTRRHRLRVKLVVRYF